MTKRLMSLVAILCFMLSVVNVPVYGATSVTGPVTAVTTNGALTVGNGGVYAVSGTGVLTINQGTSFTNNIASGTVALGGAIHATGASAVINIVTGGSPINFSGNYDVYTGTMPAQSRSNDIYLAGSTVNISGTGNVNFGGGIAGTVASIINHNTTGAVTIANNGAFLGAYTQNSGSAVIGGGVATGARMNFNLGTTASLSGNIASGATVNNQGNLTYSNGTINSAINGTGNLSINGSVTNNAVITQKSLDILSGANFTSNFSNINTTDNYITNFGTFNASGNINRNIVGSGNLVVLNGNTVTNTNSFNITQNTLSIANGGNFTSYANNLFIDTLINNGNMTITGGTLNENITGSGAAVFTGNTILSGNNKASTGGMSLNGGNVTIADGSNLTSGGISFQTANILNVTGVDVVIDNNITGASTLITINNSGDLLLKGNITPTGAADFVKNGAGHMTFDEGIANGYGNTIINAGLLSGNYNNIRGNISGTSGSVEFYDVLSFTPITFNKTVGLTGDFTKTGDAVFNVTSAAFNARNIVLIGGEFLVNSAITATDDVDVNAGALLGGNSTINADNVNINDGGTLSAGNSIDTLTVNANLNFAAGSTDLVEIEQLDIYRGLGSRSDTVSVIGASNNVEILAGSAIEVNNTAGRYFVHEKYDIITTASQNLLGEFDSPATVTGFDDFRLETAVEYDNGTAVLNVKRIKTNYENDVYGLSHNQKQVAKGIDSVSTGFGGDLVNALLAIEDFHYYNIDHESLAKAMDDISGSVYANSLMMPYFNAKKDKIYDRIYLKDVKFKQGKEGLSCYDCSNNLWVEYSASFNKVDSDGNSSEFSNAANGVLVGYDRSSVTSGLVAGIFAGYSKINLVQDSNASSEDKIDSNAITAGVYGGKIGSKWDFSGIFSGSYFDNDAERKIAFMDRKAESSYGQSNAALDLKAAYKTFISKNIRISPFAALLTNFTKQDEIQEDGAESLNLNVEEKSMLSIEASIGVSVKCRYTKFGWYVSAAASQMLTDGYGSVDTALSDYPAEFKEINGADRGNTFLDYSIGADYKLTERIIVYANLLGDLATDTTGYYGSLGAMFKW